MRILHVLDHSIPLLSGYACRTLAILEQQRALGWETVHLTGPKHGGCAALQETVDGWTFHRTGAKPTLMSRLPLGGEITLVRDLARRLQSIAAAEKPDILHAHSPVLNALPALWVGRRLNLPVVYEVRAFWEDAAVTHGTCRANDLRYRASRSLETLALKRAAAVTTICDGLRRDIVARGVAAERVTVIPNAVDLELFSGPQAPDPELAQKHGLLGKTVLGFFGSFYGYEGLHIAFKALPGLLRAEPGLRILLAGGGAEELSLRRLAAQLGVSHAVVFAGRIPHGEIRRYYDLVDIFMFPRVSGRLTELVTPLKPLEAMAQERIVLASDVGGHRELVRDNLTGFLHRPDDPDAFKARVLDVLARREDWPAIRGRALAFVRDERTWRSSVANYAALYAGVLRERARKS